MTFSEVPQAADAIAEVIPLLKGSDTLKVAATATVIMKTAHEIHQAALTEALNQHSQQ